MAVRVSPTEQRPTHHISLRDRSGRTIGLILADDQGQPVKSILGMFNKIPVETTAQKQTSGGSSYNDYEYPYSPIVQDDLSGGRGNLDFERDSTKYNDAYRATTARANKAYAGPQEQYATGVISASQSLPGNVKWHRLIDTKRYIYKRFQVTGNWTAGKLWAIVRTQGSPGDLTVTLYADSAGAVGSSLASVTVASSDLFDSAISEWINRTVSQAVTNGTYYWFVAYGASTDDLTNHWKIAVKGSVGTSYYSETFDSTPTAWDRDLYYRVTPAVEAKTCIPFSYKEQQYFVISPGSGAPSLYMAGDRGAADANTGQLDRLIDASKSWTVNQWQGSIVKIIDGLGVTEEQPWRTIASNTATELLVTGNNWTITHDTTTEYVILDDALTEITGHGLTAPVTDVIVTTEGLILYAQGDSTNIRRSRYYNNAGTWTAEYADDGTNKATLLVYKPQAKKLVKSNNRDGSGDVSVATADVVAWATASHTFAAATKVDSKYVRINGMAVYPDANGDEAVWVFKEDLPFIVPGTGNPYPLNISEMTTVRSLYNGRNPLNHNVYLYFPLGSGGLERYYGTTIDDIGPNLYEGLPDLRRGPIAYMVGYPGSVLVAVDAGTAGYSSILQSGGWHERYRAPLGQRITAMQFQPVPGTTPDRLWIYQGNDLLYLPYPSETTNELVDDNYLYTHEFCVTFSRMHAGLFDVQKLVKLVKLQSQDLEVAEDTGEPICWFEIDYRVNEDTEWTTIDQAFTVSPTETRDFIEEAGIAGKRIQFRIRGYTTDASKTPVFLAIIISAVLRTDVKYQYQPNEFRVMDDEPTLQPGEPDDIKTADEKRQLIEDWADADSDSMLWMESVSPLFHGRMVFLNPPQWRQVASRSMEGGQRDIFLGRISFQEA